ncbi:hypothetical protein SAMN05444682_1154 [Parapedobacter indicus]|uniref:Uncharacterized protein n=1 Tax=Parapedobacter indicus TaxID=1477437 RepID=A0A1I3UPE6_9SPHI|nr:hypothetical protein CLV26_115174 [Parapedobacter indicus]SFJ84802.1 hypothetical protein SAMN05444682_1154 [Parapedobacter indicus]
MPSTVSMLRPDGLGGLLRIEFIWGMQAVAKWGPCHEDGVKHQTHEKFS